MNSPSAIVLHVPPFREVPGTNGRRVGIGDAQSDGLARAVASSAQDGLNQLAAFQTLIDSARGVEGVDPEAVGNADAAMTTLAADLQAIKTAEPTGIVSTPSSFNGASFLAGLGLALAMSGILYLALENTSQPKRRPARRRTA